MGRGTSISALDVVNASGLGPEPRNLKPPVAKAISQPKADQTPTKESGQLSDPYALRNTIAQEQMAFWASTMFWAALMTLIVTSIGTFLIWRQIKLTRKAVEGTNEATKAMQEANRIAETNHRMQLRPYLFPASSWFTLNETHEPTAFIEIKNFGQSPAIDVETWYHTWVECFPLHDPLPVAPNDLLKGRSVIGPGATSEIAHPRGNALNEYSRQEIEAGRAAYYVYGKSTYIDIFGERHWSQFTLFASGKDALIKGRLASYRNGNAIDSSTVDGEVPFGI